MPLSRVASHMAALLCLGLPPAWAEAPSLSLPIACALNETCFIQSYVDTDPTEGVADYRCGPATYDGHKGTDFRVISNKAAHLGVKVLAAAPGMVKARRDGEPDRLLGADNSAVKGRECGNGLIIDHGDGWETQYCHLLRGSVRARKGQQVRRGDRLGLVGYSGKAQFAHVHLSLRHDGRIIDPFTGKAPAAGNCQAADANGLWRPEVRKLLAYQPSRIIEVGFLERPAGKTVLETGRTETLFPSVLGRALVFFARSINLREGDRLRLRLSGPSGVVESTETEPLARHKASLMSYIGRKRRGPRWDAGGYEGTVEVVRNDEVVLSRTARIELR